MNRSTILGAGIIGSLIRMEEVGLWLVEGSSQRCTLKKEEVAKVVKGEVPGRVATEREQAFMVDLEVQNGFTSRSFPLELGQPLVNPSSSHRVIRKSSDPELPKQASSASKLSSSSQWLPSKASVLHHDSVEHSDILSLLWMFQMAFLLTVRHMNWHFHYWSSFNDDLTMFYRHNLNDAYRCNPLSQV